MGWQGAFAPRGRLTLRFHASFSRWNSLKRPFTVFDHFHFEGIETDFSPRIFRRVQMRQYRHETETHLAKVRPSFPFCYPIPSLSRDLFFHYRYFSCTGFLRQI